MISLLVSLNKIDELVKYPLKNLSLSKHVAVKETETKHTYDLFGVCNHIQFNIAGGHYKSYIQYDPDEGMKTNPKIGESWYECNDEHISSKNVENVLDKNAFILFYKRHEFNASNIVDFLGF